MLLSFVYLILFVTQQQVTVTEDEIKDGMRLVFDLHKKVIEGAAGVSVGCYLKTLKKYDGQKCVVVLCGRNVDGDIFTDIVSTK